MQPYIWRNKMKHRKFNVRLYLDMLKQQRTLALVIIVLLIVATALPIIFQYSNYLAQKPQNPQYIGTIPGIIETGYVLIMFMYLGTIALVFNAFGYLNKRSSSDFYHSLPDTRMCQYISISASVMTWIAMSIVSVLLCVLLGYSLTGMPFNYSYIPRLLIVYLSGSLLVTSVALLAVGITGTRFTNIVLTGLILFLPRFVLFLTTTVVLNNVPIASSADFGLLLNPVYNIPTYFIFGSMVFPFNAGIVFDNAPSVIYTFALAAVYYCLALVVHIRRRSETADKSAPSRLLQHVYRICVALPFAILIAYGATSRNVVFISNSVIIFLVMSLGAYFLFELITTKKAKNMLKAAPYYLFVVAICAVFAVSVNVVSNAVLNTTPEPDEIAYVRIIGNYSPYEQKTYQQLLVENIRYEDAQMKNILSDNLKETVEDLNRQTGYYEGKTSVNACLHLKSGATVTRRISMKYTDYDKLFEQMKKNEEYKNSYRKMPEDNEITWFNFYPVEGNSTQDKQLWELLKQEYAALTDEQFGFLTNSGPSDNTEDFIITSGAVQGSIGLDKFYSSYGISNLTPQSAALYMQACNDASEPIATMFDEAKQLLASGKPEFFTLSMGIYNLTESPLYAEFYLDRYSQNVPGKYASFDKDDMIDIIDILSSGEFCTDVNEAFIRVSAYGYSQESGSFDTDSYAFIKLSAQKLNELTNILEQYGFTVNK